MLFLIAATTLEKMQAVPPKVWWNLALAALIFIAAIIIIRKASEMNGVLLCVVIFVVVSSVGFNWIYARNEPAFMTPLVEKIATFFPSASKQAQKAKNLPGT